MRKQIADLRLMACWNLHFTATQLCKIDVLVSPNAAVMFVALPHPTSSNWFDTSTITPTLSHHLAYLPSSKLT